MTLEAGEYLVDVLEEADAILADESKWTQQALARNSEFAGVEVTNTGAVCWCVTGAQLKVVLETTPSQRLSDKTLHDFRVLLASVVRQHFSKVTDGLSVEEWNDDEDRTFADVKTAFTKVIKLAKEETD